MPLTNPNKVVTEERLNEYHKMILPYLGGNSMVACGGGYAPIGTVISYMGTRAPSDFLICDGTVYNIADYTELADFFEAQFGSSNFFGGDGNTTFAVPDLRGEFLRGTGTNSHTNQGSGANVGVHQDGTIHANVFTSGSYLQDNKKDDSDSLASNEDYYYTRTKAVYLGDFSVDTAQSGHAQYTSRPTNTSVLYCIKAKSQGNGYSLDEQIVGTWIDGKPIYQKTVDCGQKTITNTPATICTISNVDTPVSVSILRIEGSYKDVLDNNITWSEIFTYDGNVQLSQSAQQSYSDGSYIATLQYTKTTD